MLRISVIAIVLSVLSLSSMVIKGLSFGGGDILKPLILLGTYPFQIEGMFVVEFALNILFWSFIFYIVTECYKGFRKKYF